MPVTNPIDLCVVVVYLIAVTVIGCLMSRKTHTADEFIAAGGTLPGWVVGLSIVGTFVSSISFIANPGKTFAGNWNPFVFSLSLPYAALVATVYFVPFFRNCGSLSAYEHLEERFGTWARVYSAVFNVLYHVGRIGTILFGVALAVSALIDVRIELIIVGLGILVIAYTLMGGIEAVIWTDVVQSIILIGGMLICCAVLIMDVPGGVGGIIDAATRNGQNKLSLGSMDVQFAQSTFWTVLIFGFFINLQNFAADQTFVQRYFASKSEQDAQRSVWIGAIAYLPISAILFFIGTGLFAFYSTVAELPGGTADDGVLPYFIVTQLPTGVAGLLIAAVLAAAMSTVDSSLNSSATLLLCDVRNRFFVKGIRTIDGTMERNNSGDLRFLRIMTVVLGIAGIAAALMMINIKSMLDVWWKISGVLSGGTLGLILLARFSKARGAFGSGMGVAAGVIAIAAIILADIAEPPAFLAVICNAVRPVRMYLHPLMAIVVGTTIVFVVGKLFSPRQKAEGRRQKAEG